MTDSFERRQCDILCFLSDRRKASVVVGGVVLALGVAMTTAHGAPTAASATANCDVGMAGNFAVQSNLQLINGATVNPGKYFAPGGPDSCISSIMLQSFDLSLLIPDFWGMISSAIESAIVNAVSAAMRQVCNAVNGAIQSTVGNINGQINNINGALGPGGAFSNLGGGLGYSQFNPGFTSTLNGNGTYGAGNNTSNNAFGITRPVGGGSFSFPADGGNPSGSNTGPGSVTVGTGDGGASGGGGGGVAVVGPGPSAPAGGGGGVAVVGPGPSPSKSVSSQAPANNASGASGYVPNAAPQDSRGRSTDTGGSFWGGIFGQ